MKNETKQLYFIEETQNIEGSYVEIQTLFVADDEQTAEEKYQTLLQNTKRSTGLLLNEYVIQADDSFFKKLLRSWKKLPAEFYRKMNILNFRSLAEYKN
ncbi:hypothetical protein [Enterococcus sp. CSURQ0835]|uniref:hypothetical protein n=1 Tax=Enterococcus sp. CSURQ0835 TaxID=2681394 RepID=UPI00135B10F3|nr:hypothetical protein [Enterococcus sp. CSURQ0835]